MDRLSNRILWPFFVVVLVIGGISTIPAGAEEETNAHRHGHKGHGHDEEQEHYNRDTGHDEAPDTSRDRHGNQNTSHRRDQRKGHGDHEDHGEEAIELDEETRSMIQLQTETVRRRKLGGRLKVYGKIAQDTENYSYVTFDGDGRIEKIHVELGAIVDKGDILVSVRRDDGTVEEIVSDMHGVVLSVFVKPQERIDRLTSLLSIADVDTMRATIDIYEKDLHYVHVGQKVVLTTSAFPDKKFEGKVVYISPKVDEHTQSIKVRVDVNNPEHLLRLGMFVAGELIYASDKMALAVPVSAVQRLKGEDVVFVVEEGDRLKLREVVLGQRTKNYIEVKKGLKEGDIVVTRGSFYLKSEKAKESFGQGHAH